MKKLIVRIAYKNKIQKLCLPNHSQKVTVRIEYSLYILNIKPVMKLVFRQTDRT